MEIRCKNCGTPIPAEDINLANALAKCRQCHAVFSFAGAVGLPASAPTAPVKREKVPLPPAIQVEEGMSKLTLTRRWFSPVYIFLAFFCVMWDGFLVFWYGAAMFGMGAEAGGPATICALLFPLGHVAVGLGLTYTTIAGFFNRTLIEVTRGSLKISHGPIPWWGNQDLRTADLKQLFCEEQVHRGKHGSRNYTYDVHAVLQDGRKHKLLSGLPSTDQALYIEQAIETHLEIEDRHVPGEVPK